MGDDKDFQKRVQKIGELVQRLETIADPATRADAKDLIQLLMDLHGEGLERMLEIVFESSEAGTQIVDEFGRDQLVGSLLILYGIHPEELQTRVERKLVEIGAELNKMGAEAHLISADNGNVRLSVTVAGHGCGSTIRTVEATLEEAMYEAAPDLKSLLIEGAKEGSAAGFVTLDKLLANSPHAGLSKPADETHARLLSKGMD